MTIYRFDQIAANITIRVQPADTDLERYVGLEHLDPESLKLRRWGSPADVIGQKLKFWKGDIIYGKRRAYQRKLAVADFDGICSAHAMVLRAKPDVILPEFLPFFMQSEIFNQRAVEISVGSLSPTINWSALAKQEFFLPSLDEQKRFVEILNSIDDYDDSLHQLIQTIIGLEKSTFQGITSSEKYVSLREISDLITKGTTPTTLGFDYVDSGIPFVRAEDVPDSEVHLDTCTKHIDASTHEAMSRSKIKPNDILVSIAGTIGRIGIVPEGIGEANCNQAVAIIRLKKEFNPHFIFSYLMSPIAQAQIHGNKVVGTIPNLSLTNINGITVPLLSPLDEKEFIEKFNALKNTQLATIETIENLKKIKQNILFQASKP
jgi:type I restriction enzyme S subunit